MRCAVLFLTLMLFSEVAMAFDPGECFVRQMVSRIGEREFDRVIGYSINRKNERFLMIRVMRPEDRGAGDLLTLLKGKNTRKLYERFGFKWDPEEQILWVPDPETLNRFLARAYGDVPYLRVGMTERALSHPDFVRAYSTGRFTYSRKPPFLHELFDHFPATLLIKGKTKEVLQARAKMWITLHDFVYSGEWPVAARVAIRNKIKSVAVDLESNTKLVRTISAAMDGNKIENADALRESVEKIFGRLVNMGDRNTRGPAEEISEFLEYVLGNPVRYGFERRADARLFVEAARRELSGLDAPSVARGEVRELADEIVDIAAGIREP